LEQIADKGIIMNSQLNYQERLTSKKTTSLFVSLTLIFLLLFIRRLNTSALDTLAALLLFFSTFFLFYTLNYRALIIILRPDALKLKFGLFSWAIPLDNIASCSRDQLPAFKRLGGAGIHFMTVRGRYRASFNFLEHPRLVVALKAKAGPIRDISFSTSRPSQLLPLIQQAVSLKHIPASPMPD
jgi:hypothetical protein